MASRRLEEGGRVRTTWGIWAYTRYQSDSAELDRLEEKHGSARAIDNLRERLKEARDAVLVPYGFFSSWSLFYSGSRIERAWSNLHQVERDLLLLYDPDTLRGKIPLVRSAVARYLPAANPDRQSALEDLDELEASERELGSADAERLRSMLALAHGSSDETNRRVRSFRNLWLVFALLLLTVLVGVGFVHFFDTSLVSLCSRDIETLGDDLCPGGGASNRRFDVFEVELLGAVGGLLAAVVRLAKAKKMPGPYGVSIALNVLKVASGAGTALVGVLLLQKGLFVGLPQQPGSEVIAYAALFGFAQQLLTNLVDRRASDLAERTGAAGEQADESSPE